MNLFWKIWLIEIEHCFSTRLKENGPFVLHDSKNWTFFQYDSKKCLLLFQQYDSKNWALLKNMTFKNWTFWKIWFKDWTFWSMIQRIEPFFLNTTHRIKDWFFQFDSKHSILLFQFDSKNWTSFSIWLKELNFLFTNDSKTWTFF